MFIYNKKSSSKVIHYPHCRHAAHLTQDKRGVFDTPQEATAAGYRLCKCCAPMTRFYRKEAKALERFAAENGLSYSYEDGMLDIKSPHSQWKVIVSGKGRKKLFLYHKNTQVRKNEKPSIVPGYHSQAYHTDTLLGYMEFVISHDAYRLEHSLKPQPKEVVIVNPLAIASSKKNKKKKKNKPLTKQRLRAQKRAERLSHIGMVHRMIEEERRKQEAKEAELVLAGVELAQATYD